MPTEKIAIERLELKLLDDGCRCRGFRCGVNYIDRWFHEKAGKRHRKYACRVTTAHFIGNSTPVGFYALVLNSEPIGLLHKAQRSFGWETASFPAVQVLYLGVHNTVQRNGIGQILLSHAMERVYEIAKIAGVYAMTLVPREGVEGFYHQMGFRPYGTAGGMLLPAQTIVDLFEQNA